MILAPEKGVALMEVVVASVVLGIASVGVAMMLSSARSFTVAQGDQRVAFYLAQEKLEKLRGQGVQDFTTLLLSPGDLSTCPSADTTNCYIETLTTGADNTQTFSRSTAVDCVTKTVLDPVIPPASSPCDPTDPLWQGVVFKRITVRVTPTMPQAQVNPVAVQTVLACPVFPATPQSCY
jgi:hypothetical protein